MNAQGVMVVYLDLDTFVASFLYVHSIVFQRNNSEFRGENKQ